MKSKKSKATYKTSKKKSKSKKKLEGWYIGYDGKLQKLYNEDKAKSYP